MHVVCSGARGTGSAAGADTAIGVVLVRKRVIVRAPSGAGAVATAAAAAAAKHGAVVLLGVCGGILADRPVRVGVIVILIPRGVGCACSVRVRHGMVHHEVVRVVKGPAAAGTAVFVRVVEERRQRVVDHIRVGREALLLLHDEPVDLLPAPLATPQRNDYGQCDHGKRCGAARCAADDCTCTPLSVSLRARWSGVQCSRRELGGLYTGAAVCDGSRSQGGDVYVWCAVRFDVPRLLLWPEPEPEPEPEERVGVAPVLDAEDAPDTSDDAVDWAPLLDLDPDGDAAADDPFVLELA